MRGMVVAAVLLIIFGSALGYYLYRNLRPYYLHLELKSIPEEVPATSGLLSFISRGKGDNFSRFLYKLSRLEKDRRLRGIYLDLSLYSMNLSQSWELREVLGRLRESGKRVLCYAHSYRQSAYFLATACDRIYMAPGGVVEIPGVMSQNFYFRELFDTLDIVPQFLHREEYKSAVEPFTRREPSPYDREQRERLLEIYYHQIAEALGSRGASNPDELINEYGFLYGREALDLGLVDSLLYPDEVEDMLKEEFGRATKRRSIPSRRESIFAFKKVAVVVASGPIVEEDTHNPFEGTTTIGTGLASTLRKLRRDRRVAAVVIRVNSPGGSALTSDIIAHEVRKLAQEKPVVISMGFVAASGGYYISAYGNEIFLTPLTITGSIGVLFGKLAMEDFFRRKLHINPFVMKRGELADAFSLKPVDEKGIERFNKLIDEIYGDFLKVVSEGRDMPVDSVREIAKGRIWVGEDGIRAGIVDTIGSVVDAIEYARKEAGGGSVVFVRRKYRTNFDWMSLLSFARTGFYMVDFRFFFPDIGR